jgi:hypothetical protein
MSVILEALKKLDREKSFRRDGTFNISAEILRPDLSPPGKRVRLYFAIITLTVVVTFAITYAVMVQFGLLSKSSPPISVSSPAPGQKVTTTIPEASSTSKPLPLEPMRPTAPSQPAKPAPLSREPTRDRKRETSQETPKIQVPVENKTPTEIEPSVMPSSTASMDEKKADKIMVPEKSIATPEITKKTVEPIPNGTSSTPPPIKISAIVWYKDPPLRFAMINGIKATEGSLVEGVKVVEINPTSVRFFHNDQYFEISMLK